MLFEWRAPFGKPSTQHRWGGLWVVEAPSKEAVLALLVTDPYFTCGLRQSHEVLHWRKAFPSRQVAV